MSVRFGSQRPYPEFRQHYATERPAPVVWRWDTLAKEIDTSEHTEYGTCTLSTPDGSMEVTPGTSMTFQVVRPGDRTTPHEHAWWHLYFVRAGTGTMVFGDPDDTVGLDAGDIVFIPAWVQHHLENGTTDDLLLLNMSNLPQQGELNNLLSKEGGK